MGKAGLVTHKIIIIRSIIHIAVLSFVSFMWVMTTQAQVRFYTLVSESEISGSQTFQVQYVVEGATDIKQFRLPGLSNFQVYDIFPTNSSSINSQNKFVDVHSTIVILSPKRTGKFTIPGASAVINGKRMRSNAVKIIVRANSISSLITGEDNNEGVAIEEVSELRPGESIEDKIKKNFFLKVDVNKNACYVGECLLATYKVYSRLNASSQVLKRPSFTGFGVIEMVDAYDNKPEIENINGVPYYVNLIRKVQLFPLQEGIFVLDPAEVESIIHFMKINDDPVSGKDDLKHLLDRTSPGTPGIRVPYNHHLTLATNPVPIRVKPLPKEKQPETFTGAIGSFTVSTHISNNKVHPGDLVKLQLVVSGTGNLPLITAPVINWPVAVDTADPQVKEQINKYVYPLQGTKMFEYSFTAPDTGTYVIPAATLSYYDPTSKGYKNAVSDSVKLQVTPPEKSKEGSREEPTGYLPISNTPKHLYWFALVVAIIVGWISYQSWQLYKAKNANAEKKVAIKSAVLEHKPVEIHPLTAARNALYREQPFLFYRELQRALWKAIGDKYDIPPSALNKQNITGILISKGIAPETISELMAILHACEWSSYAPEHENSNAEKLLEQSEAIIGRL